VKLGLVLPTTGAGAGSEAIDVAAATAARLRWSSVWVTDHLLVPTGAEADEYGRALEAMVALSWVAGRHPDLRVGFSVLIPAMRDAPLLAKQLATLDLLAGGRLIVGVGSSQAHDLPEYQNLGKAERFPVRGAYLDETIALWRHLWSGSTAPFEGEFHQLRDYVFDPLPSQRDTIPIWAGGRGDRVLRRAATMCDGYHAAQTGPQDILDRVPKLERYAIAAGRPRVTVSVRVRVRFGGGPLPVYSLHSTPADMIEEVVDFARAGVDELVLVFAETGPERLAAAIEHFDAEVAAPARALL
jgi:alkanesulfonate monooxygenase SsuD/methylene tetrahydromethanopterin reductase-like flavin-dependent oxidoreductase (luciferase family)